MITKAIISDIFCAVVGKTSCTAYILPGFSMGKKKQVTIRGLSKNGIHPGDEAKKESAAMSPRALAHTTRAGLSTTKGAGSHATLKPPVIVRKSSDPKPPVTMRKSSDPKPAAIARKGSDTQAETVRSSFAMTQASPSEIMDGGQMYPTDEEIVEEEKKAGARMLLSRAFPTMFLTKKDRTTVAMGGGEVEKGVCGLCLEDGEARDCCGREYCDHCYGTRQSCPNCGVRLDHGVPILTHADDDLAYRAALECRRCLKQGYRRKCCDEYYCNDCYYITGFCPSCNKPVAKTGVTDQRPIPDPGFWPVAISYVITGTLSLLTLTFALFWISNDILMPRTVQGFTCYGILPKCTDTDQCVNWDPAAVGEKGSVLPSGFLGRESVHNMSQWRACTPRDEMAMVGPTCVFDEELYAMSNATLGYDFCVSKFDDGVQTFKDDFELWPNSTGYRGSLQKAAKWADIINAKVDNECGTGQGNRSLHFSGADLRYAQTLPMDFSYGGVIKFQLKFGSDEDSDVIYSECKPAYGGNVRVLWSKDLIKWNTVAEYNPARQAESYFYNLSVTLPREAFSNATSLRFQQTEFNSLRDHWAIDNVRIVHKFPSNWRKSSLGRAVLRKSRAFISHIQCCYRTLQCPIPDLKPPTHHCGPHLSNYKPKEKPLHGAELLVLIALVVSVLRSLYNTITSDRLVQYIDRWRTSKQIAADKPPPGLLTGDFHLRRAPLWQLLASLSMLGCLGVMVVVNGTFVREQPYTLTQTYRALRGFGPKSNDGYVDVHASTPLGLVYVMAMYLDAKDVWTFLSRVVCVVPGLVPSLSVDATPHVSTLQIGADRIALDDVVGISRFSYGYCVGMALKLMIGTLPWASVLLFTSLIHLYFPVFRRLRWILFFGAVCKAFYGPGWLIKLQWALEYFYTHDVRARDEVGNQLINRKPRWLALYWAGAGFSVSLLTLAIVRYDWLGGGIVVCTLFGALFGFFLGIAQGLPLVPLFFLTTLDMGLCLRITRRRDFPCCLYRCRHFPKMHSRDEMVMAFVDEDYRMVALLKGIPTLPAGRQQLGATINGMAH